MRALTRAPRNSRRVGSNASAASTLVLQRGHRHDAWPLGSGRAGLLISELANWRNSTNDIRILVSTRTGQMQPNRTLAGIVVYNPDRLAVERLVERLSHDVDGILIYANSAIGEDLAATLRAKAGSTPVAILGDGNNVGLGAAYNAMLEEAERLAGDFLLIFDQDSVSPPGMAQQLSALHRSLSEIGERPAALGPRFVDARGVLMWPKLRDSGAAPGGIAATRVECVISSGSLIDLAAARQIGPFRADFFIDGIDVEWGLRAAGRGFSSWVARDVSMAHSIGIGVIKGPFGLILPYHPPLRTYTLIRNQAAMLRMSHIPIRYKGKVILFLPLRMAIYLFHGRFAPALWHAVWRGIVDGLFHRLGPPLERLGTNRKREK
jgi:rhamnosyltransferase